MGIVRLDPVILDNRASDVGIEASLIDLALFGLRKDNGPPWPVRARWQTRRINRRRQMVIGFRQRRIFRRIEIPQPADPLRIARAERMQNVPTARVADQNRARSNFNASMTSSTSSARRCGLQPLEG
jgi:hypothetical protein